MRVTELDGALLDYWVAKAEALESPEIVSGNCQYIHHYEPGDDGWYQLYRPHTLWEDGGPIIERARIQILPLPSPSQSVRGAWEAFLAPGRLIRGSTPLVAAMRAYVASKFGYEVPDIHIDDDPKPNPPSR